MIDKKQVTPKIGGVKVGWFSPYLNSYKEITLKQFMPPDNLLFSRNSWRSLLGLIFIIAVFPPLRLG